MAIWVPVEWYIRLTAMARGLTRPPWPRPTDKGNDEEGAGQARWIRSEMGAKTMREQVLPDSRLTFCFLRLHVSQA